MSALLYYLILKPISLLPFWVLYGFSDFLYLFIYKIFGYRTSVVKTNLTNSFPDKSPKEIKEIQDKFYHHLCDLIVESIKLFSISKKEAEKRLVFTNPELTDAYFEKGQNLNVIGAHYGNWEYIATIANLNVLHQLAGIYTPLTNKFFENKMIQSRSKYGMLLIPTSEVKEFYKNQPTIPTMMIYGSDQSPRSSKKSYWTRFLNQDTAVSYGAEKYSKEFNYPLFYGAIKKVKRGFYEVTLKLIEDKPQQTQPGEMTEKHVRILENQILEQPEHWLWTHKRWKREKPDDVIITPSSNS